MNLWRLKGCSTRSRAGGCGFTLPEVVVAVGVLTLAVLWNWFTVQWGPYDIASNLTWIFIDTTVPMLGLAVGRRLWREAAS